MGQPAKVTIHKIPSGVRGLDDNLADVVLNQDLNAVYDEITKQVTAAHSGIVVVDSFRTVVRKAPCGGVLDSSRIMQFAGVSLRKAKFYL